MRKGTGKYRGRQQKKPVVRRTAQILATHWNELQELARDNKICYNGSTKEDILIDTFERIIRNSSLKKASAEEIIKAFTKEFKQLHFRNVKNCLAERKTDGLDL